MPTPIYDNTFYFYLGLFYEGSKRSFVVKGHVRLSS